MSLSRQSDTERRVISVGESALEADVARCSVLVEDDPHRDAAGWANRRALVIGVGLALLVHAATLARGSALEEARTRRHVPESAVQLRGRIAGVRASRLMWERPSMAMNGSDACFASFVPFHALG